MWSEKGGAEPASYPFRVPSPCTSSHSGQAVCQSPGLQITAQLPVITLLLIKVILASRKSLAKTIHQLLGIWALTSFPTACRTITINFYTQNVLSEPRAPPRSLHFSPCTTGSRQPEPMAASLQQNSNCCRPMPSLCAGGPQTSPSLLAGERWGQELVSALTSRASLSALTSPLFSSPR